MKRFISALLALFTITALICVPVVAGDDSATTPTVSVWDGYYPNDAGWAGGEDYALQGEGTENSPWQIKSAMDLAYFCYLMNFRQGRETNAWYVEQCVDIDLANKPWTPISAGNNPSLTGTTNSYYFGGSYDGQGYIISGLNVTDASAWNVKDKAGLFGYTNANAVTFKNMTVKGSITGSFTKAGGIVGYTKNANIENCYTDVDITLGTESAGVSSLYAGGLVGHFTVPDNSATYNFKINNCVVEGNIQVYAGNNQFKVGGLVGYANGITQNAKTISNSYFTGNIKVDRVSEVEQGSDMAVGGIAGSYLNDRATIDNCHVLGTVKVNNVTPTETASSKRIGLFVGDWGNPTTTNTDLDLSITNSTCFVPTSDDFTFKDPLGYSRQSAVPTIPTITLNEATTEAITLRALQRKTSTEGSQSFDIRLLATMNSTSYDKAGYQITAINASGATASVTRETTTVYEKITAGSTPYTAGTISNDVDKYIVALGMTGIPTNGTVTLIVTPFVTLGDTTSYGATTVILYEDGAFVGFFTPGETQVTE